MLERLPGALGAIVVDWEGEAVDQSGSMDEYQLKVMGAHKGVILNKLKEVIHRLSDDRLSEIVITTEQAQILILPVTQDYFLVLTLSREEMLGRALFEARRCIPALKAEIE